MVPSLSLPAVVPFSADAQTFVTGLAVTFSLIVAIGPQNAFILRQGLLGRPVGLICLICAASDALLIVAGVSGMQSAIAVLPWLDSAARWAGAAFLFIYGLTRLHAATQPSASLALLAAEGAGASQTATLLSCLAFTWLNPHVYLDSVFLVGSVAAQYPGRETAFTLGAVTASFLFFFALGYASRWLQPLFTRPSAWRTLEAAIGGLMWMIAASLIAI